MKKIIAVVLALCLSVSAVSAQNMSTQQKQAFAAALTNFVSYAKQDPETLSDMLKGAAGNTFCQIFIVVEFKGFCAGQHLFISLDDGDAMKAIWEMILAAW